LPRLLDRAGELLRDERQYVAILLTIADIHGVALNHQISENPVGSFEGHAHPIQRGRTNQFDLTLLDQRVKHLRGTKQRFAGAEDVFSETAAELFGRWPRICFIDEVRKAEQLSYRIVQSDIKISRVHQLRDRSVNRAIEL